MSYRRILLPSLVGLALVACADPNTHRSSLSLGVRLGSSNETAADPATRRHYGPSVRIGRGFARTYVIVDKKNPSLALEVGVALDEPALEGLPLPDPHAAHRAAQSAHEHVDNHVYLLSMPKVGVAPYKFVELDWNPGGHEPPGIYDKPHFDFHFYTTSREERASIVPSDPDFQKKADDLPREATRPANYIMAAPPGAPAPAVPLMGVHWVDVRSPELQKMLGKPDAYRPFTSTFIYGSWAGRFIFVEPMITREYILSKKAATDVTMQNEVIPVPAPAQVDSAGYYPSAYRIAWDAKAREYRIGLTQLAWRN